MGAIGMGLASLGLFLSCGLAVIMGVESEDAGRLAFMGVFAVALFVAGVGGLVRGLVFRTRLSVYGNGVLVETIWSKTFTCWDDIDAILEFDPPSERNMFGWEESDYRCGFSRIGGRAFWFRISRMSGLREFAARLHERLDDPVRERARQALAAGRVAWFGPIGIGRDGVHSRKGILPWAEVFFAGCVHDEYFEVLKRGSNWGWFSKKISAVGNVAILNELIRSRKEWASLG